jgi:hypothetical protein
MAENVSKATYYVVLYEGLDPATGLLKEPSLAYSEATKLAKQNPGEAYTVYRAIKTFSVSEVTVTSYQT